MLQLGLGVGTRTPTVFSRARFPARVPCGRRKWTRSSRATTPTRAVSTRPAGPSSAWGRIPQARPARLDTGTVRLRDGRGTFLAYGGPRTLSNLVVMTGTIPRTSPCQSLDKNDLTFAGSFDYSALTQPLQSTREVSASPRSPGRSPARNSCRKHGPGTVVFANARQFLRGRDGCDRRHAHRGKHNRLGDRSGRRNRKRRGRPRWHRYHRRATTLSTGSVLAPGPAKRPPARSPSAATSRSRIGHFVGDARRHVGG